MSRTEQKVKGHNFKDLTDKRFGFLTAIRPTSERCGGNVKWECKCDCGNIKIVSSGNLVRGQTRSCGCYKKSGKPYIGKNQKDLTGMRFGRLKVVMKTDDRAKDRCIMWKCVCDCGKTVNVASHNLISGETTSCGCFKEEQRIKGIKKPECIEKQRKKSLERWPSSAEKIGMRDGTNISILKSQKVRRDSSTGVRGVYKKKDKYYVMLTFMGEKYRRYGFKNIESAKKAREKMYEEIVVPYLNSVKQKTE